MIKVYLSGPVTGMRGNNKRAFDKAHEKVEDAFCGLGFYDAAVVNPLKVAEWVREEFKIRNVKKAKKEKPQWSDYMRYCIQQLCQSTHVFFLSGWEKSKGATLERHIAEALGIPFAENTEGLKIILKEYSNAN